MTSVVEPHITSSGMVSRRVGERRPSVDSKPLLLPVILIMEAFTISDPLSSIHSASLNPSPLLPNMEWIAHSAGVAAIAPTSSNRQRPGFAFWRFCRRRDRARPMSSFPYLASPSRPMGDFVGIPGTRLPDGALAALVLHTRGRVVGE